MSREGMFDWLPHIRKVVKYRELNPSTTTERRTFVKEVDKNKNAIGYEKYLKYVEKIKIEIAEKLTDIENTVNEYKQKTFLTFEDWSAATKEAQHKTRIRLFRYGMQKYMTIEDFAKLNTLKNELSFSVREKRIYSFGELITDIERKRCFDAIQKSREETDFTANEKIYYSDVEIEVYKKYRNRALYSNTLRYNKDGKQCTTVIASHYLEVLEMPKYAHLHAIINKIRDLRDGKIKMSDLVYCRMSDFLKSFSENQNKHIFSIHTTVYKKNLFDVNFLIFVEFLTKWNKEQGEPMKERPFIPEFYKFAPASIYENINDIKTRAETDRRFYQIKNVLKTVNLLGYATDEEYINKKQQTEIKKITASTVSARAKLQNIANYCAAFISDFNNVEKTHHLSEDFRLLKVCRNIYYPDVFFLYRAAYKDLRLCDAVNSYMIEKHDMIIKKKDNYLYFNFVANADRQAAINFMQGLKKMHNDFIWIPD